MTDALTTENAPRDYDQLLQVTPYQLRTLVGSMGLLETAEAKQGWHSLNQSEKATMVFNGLKALDGQGGAPARQPPAPVTGAQPMAQAPRPGGIPLPAGLPGVPRMPPQPPSMNTGAPVPPPPPPQVAQAPQAPQANGVAGPAVAAPPKGPNKRNPPPPAPVSPPQELAAAEQGSALFLEVMGQVQALMVENQKLNEKVEALTKTLKKDETAKVLGEINGGLKTLGRTSSWLLTLGLMQAEFLMKSTNRNEIMEQMLAESEDIRAMLDAQATAMGKY